MQHHPRLLLLLVCALLAGCPKPVPDPVPADCSKPGTACAGEPAPAEGPPPVGSIDPPKG